MTWQKAALHALAIGGGAALGALLRFGAGWMAKAWLPAGFPYGTFAVNLVGSFCLGLAMPWLMREQTAPIWFSFLAVGLLGGFTTFSSFTMESLGLIQEGRGGAAAAYMLLSVLLGLGMAGIGWALGTRFVSS